MNNSRSMIKKVKYLSQTNTYDLPLLLVVLALVGFGLVMVYDASSVQGLKDYGDSFAYIKQQLIWASIGILSMLFFIRFNARLLKKFATLILLGSLILLLAVFIPGWGVSGGGAHRWLNFGSITVQPAEVFKVAGIIFLSKMYEKKMRFLPTLILISLVIIIVALFQRDLGSAISFITSAGILYIAAGGAIWHFLASLPLVLGAIYALIFTSEYRRNRILAFLDPFSDTQGFTYHISQVLIALGSGGLFGLGLGNSRQKFEYIPEVTTDSIFAIIGEELGFVGGIILITLFVTLILRGIKISASSPDNFGKILAIGLTTLIGVQTAINLSSMTALLPLTGVPLPFISYGGSALVANLSAIGILLNISKSNARS